VIGEGRGKVKTYADWLTEEDNAFVLSQVGDTMKRLGYE
jgi:hypothetical protein